MRLCVLVAVLAVAEVAEVLEEDKTRQQDVSILETERSTVGNYQNGGAVETSPQRYINMKVRQIRYSGVKHRRKSTTIKNYR